MKTYYMYEHNNQIIGHNSDPNTLRKAIANQFYPDEPEADIIELKIETYQDSVYISGKKVNCMEEKDLFDVIFNCGFDMGEWQYIETEFIGNNEYRAIFHQI